MDSTETLMLIRTSETAELVGAFRPQDVIALERTFQTVLHREALGTVRCSPAVWNTLHGPCVRPSLVVKDRANGLAKLLWARANGDLLYIVVPERVLEELHWLALAHVAGAWAHPHVAGTLSAALSGSIAGHVVFAALAGGSGSAVPDPLCPSGMVA